MFVSDKRPSLAHKDVNYRPKIFLQYVRGLKFVPLLVQMLD